MVLDAERVHEFGGAAQRGVPVWDMLADMKDLRELTVRPRRFRICSTAPLNTELRRLRASAEGLERVCKAQGVLSGRGAYTRWETAVIIRE